jgi:hypothetical protein
MLPTSWGAVERSETEGRVVTRRAPPLRFAQHLPRSRGRMAAHDSRLSSRHSARAATTAQALGRGVVAVTAPRVAAADPGRCHPAAGPSAVPTDRIGGIGRACRQVAAIAPDQGRERPLIELDEAQKAPGRNARRHRISLVGFDRDKRRRCGAPDPAPPALVSGRGENAAVHEGHITGCGAFLNRPSPVQNLKT